MANYRLNCEPWPTFGPPCWPGKAEGTTAAKFWPGCRLPADANFSADAILSLVYRLPSGSLPAGTPYIMTAGVCDDVSHNAKINPKYRLAAPGEAWFGSVTAEGTQTIAFGSGDDNKIVEVAIEITAVTLVPDEYLMCDFTFEHTNWTLDQVSTWLLPWIEWVA